MYKNEAPSTITTGGVWPVVLPKLSNGNRTEDFNETSNNLVSERIHDRFRYIISIMPEDDKNVELAWQEYLPSNNFVPFLVNEKDATCHFTIFLFYVSKLISG